MGARRDQRVGALAVHLRRGPFCASACAARTLNAIICSSTPGSLYRCGKGTLRAARCTRQGREERGPGKQKCPKRNHALAQGLVRNFSKAAFNTTSTMPTLQQFEAGYAPAFSPAPPGVGSVVSPFRRVHKNFFLANYNSLASVLLARHGVRHARCIICGNPGKKQGSVSTR